MVFFGTALFGFDDIASPVATNINDIENVTLQNSEIDNLYMTKDTTIEISETVPTLWDYNTIMVGDYENNVEVGNVDFTINMVSDLLIKRRKVGEFNWMTLFQKPITKIEDFVFIVYDKYARSNQEYEYAFVPIIEGAEGSYNTEKVLSTFEGAFLVDADHTYGTKLSTVPTFNPNKTKAIVKTSGSKYPHVISNNDENYLSGDLSAIWVKLNCDDCVLEFEDGWKYRQEFMNFVLDNHKKIYKYGNGYMVMCNTGTNSQINETYGLVLNAPTTYFDWVETGDAESFDELLEEGFIVDIDEELVRNV